MSGHRLVALIEVVSPASKDRRDHVVEFATKVASALGVGIHVLLIDLFSPGSHDEHGMNGAILDLLVDADEPHDPPANEPLTLVSYVAGPQVEAYAEPLAVGQVLPEMPLFLQVDRYINPPLEPAYQAAFQGRRYIGERFWNGPDRPRNPLGERHRVRSQVGLHGLRPARGASLVKSFLSAFITVGMSDLFG